MSTKSLALIPLTAVLVAALCALFLPDRILAMAHQGVASHSQVVQFSDDNPARPPKDGPRRGPRGHHGPPPHHGVPPTVLFLIGGALGYLVGTRKRHGPRHHGVPHHCPHHPPHCSPRPPEQTAE